MEAIPFTLSDESVNEYGFRVLTAGIDLSHFKKNPVMLYAHIRAYERQSGKPMFPIGKWNNVRVVSQPLQPLVADAIMDHDGPDETANIAAHKVKNGFLNTASVYLDIIELSEDPALMVQGQTRPTIVKSILKEASIADIPGNANCARFTLSYQGQEIKLDGTMDEESLNKIFSNHKPNQSSMKNLIVKFNALKLQGITLSDTASEADVMLALDSLINKNTALTDLNKSQGEEIVKLTSEKEGLSEKLIAAEKLVTDEKAVLLVKGAIADKKISANQEVQYVRLAKVDYEGTKEILDQMKPFQSPLKLVNETEQEENALTGDEALVAKYEEMFRSNKLASYKKSDPEGFKVMQAAWVKHQQTK